MFNATYFYYDGRSSMDFSLQIADFDDATVKETDAYAPSLKLQKAPGAVKFLHSGVEYDSAPTCEFSILREQPLNATEQRSVMSWLTGRHAFKPLQFIGGDNAEFTYYCVFSAIKTIWVHGRCFGFRLTATFDSPFARGVPTQITVEAGTHTEVINNRSDIIDDYTYPIVQFSGSSVDIVNTTDDPDRHFTFSGLDNGETVTVDNEARYIVSSLGGEKLSNFTSKKWLRLRQGDNTLEITASGTVTITCPYYVMIGF